MSGVSAKQYMENWLLQINFPNIKIELQDLDSARNRVTFAQERFLLTKPSGGLSPFKLTNFERDIYILKISILFVILQLPMEDLLEMPCWWHF